MEAPFSSIRLTSRQPEDGLGIKVAFASDDLLHLTEHFGRAKRFVVYRLDGAGAWIESVLSFHHLKASGSSGIMDKLEALKGTDVIVAGEIGPEVTVALVRIGISPVKVKAGETVEGFLQKLVRAIEKDPPPWLKQLLAPKSELARRTKSTKQRQLEIH